LVKKIDGKNSLFRYYLAARMATSTSCGCGAVNCPDCLEWGYWCPFPLQEERDMREAVVCFDGLTPDYDYGYGGLTESGDGLTESGDGFCPGSDSDSPNAVLKARASELTRAYQGAGAPEWASCSECRGEGRYDGPFAPQEEAEDYGCPRCDSTGVDPLQLVRLQEQARMYEQRSLPQITAPLPVDSFWAAVQIPWNCILCEGACFQADEAGEECPRCEGSGVFTPEG